MEKKIRITLLKQVMEIIGSDLDNFKITKNYLLNYIFEHMKNEKINDNFFFEGEKTVIQFNLNKRNLSTYYDFLQEKNIQVEADFIRKLIYKYANQSRKNRELFIFQSIIERLESAIKDKKIIKIHFKDRRTTSVLPFYIGSSKLELSNYLFCYDINEEKYRNYRISNIDTVFITKEVKILEDMKFVEKVIKDFDPFLSQGKEIKAILTSEGEKILKEVKLNRPEIISKKGNFYEFQCSEEKAKRYFTYFLDEIEILEPLSLREWFKNKYLNACKKYLDNSLFKK